MILSKKIRYNEKKKVKNKTLGNKCVSGMRIELIKGGKPEGSIMAEVLKLKC